MPKPSNKSPKLSSNTRLSTSEPLSPFVRAFLKRVLNTVTRYQLWSHKESFIVAVSGGPDSLCLLDVLFLLSQKYDFTLRIVHVNYRLRGKDSDLDEACVRARATTYHLPLSVFHPRPISSSNLEEKLRDIRYRYFERVLLQKKATLIAVAHHQDDQAETFLLRLLRGSGMQGLSAMLPKNNSVVRPLIEMNRAEILQYLKERNISYREDTSNTDSKFFRNQLRNTLIPLIEKNYQPQIKKILADTATLLAADYVILEKISNSLSFKASLPSQEFSVATLLKLPEALLKHKLRSLLRPFFQEKSPPQGLIQEIIKLLHSTKNKHQTMTFKGLKIERKGDKVRLLNFIP